MLIKWLIYARKNEALDKKVWIKTSYYVQVLRDMSSLTTHDVS